jgi:hypothetical protein
MQTGQVRWDAIREPFGLDLTTKLVALYLMASVLAFLVLSIRFLPVLKRLRASVALLRAHKPIPSDTDGQQVNADNPMEKQFRIACTAIQSAVVALRRWVQLTVLILLAYSATEIVDLLREISLNKVIGTSAISGSLANIASTWMCALWLFVVLWIANWMLSHRLMSCADRRVGSVQ